MVHESSVLHQLTGRSHTHKSSAGPDLGDPHGTPSMEAPGPLFCPGSSHTDFPLMILLHVTCTESPRLQCQPKLRHHAPRGSVRGKEHRSAGPQTLLLQSNLQKVSLDPGHSPSSLQAAPEQGMNCPHSAYGGKELSQALSEMKST